MHRNKIDLAGYGIEKNKDFTKNLHAAELENKNILFQWVDRNISWERENDEGMNIEKFIPLLDKGIEKSILQLGSIYDFKFDDIEHFISSKKKTVKIAYCICPYKKANYEIVSKIFKESFGCDMESIPVPEELVEHYNRLDRIEKETEEFIKRYNIKV